MNLAYQDKILALFRDDLLSTQSSPEMYPYCYFALSNVDILQLTNRSCMHLKKKACLRFANNL